MKSITILYIIFIIILVLGGLVFFVNRKEKYEDVAQVVILNPGNIPSVTISAERENSILCDTSNPDYPICLDFYKINHPRTSYNTT